MGLSNAVLVVGWSGDKDAGALADALASLATHVIATRSRHPRAAEPRAVADAFAEREIPVTIGEPVGAAIDAAHALASPGGAVVICGSLFVAAEAREHVLGIEYDPPPDVIASSSRTTKHEVRV